MEQEKSLDEISLYDSMKELVTGNTKNIFTASAVDSASAISKSFLTPCDSFAMTKFYSFFGYMEWTYYFHSKGIEIIEATNYSIEEPQIIFILTSFSEPKERP